MKAKTQKASTQAQPDLGTGHVAAAPAAQPPASQPEPAAPTPASPEFPTEVVDNLKALGFPEPQVLACLRASHGNPDMAVEFLMNGIPSAASIAEPTSSAGDAGDSLDALRNHPQFNDLRRLVQSNPSTLQTVLAQIGQQQPDLLRAINANQATFLQMMNEPVNDTADAGDDLNPPINASDNNDVNPFSMDPTQLSALLSSMPPEELAAMAQMMGMSVQQMQQTAQMISGLPREQIQQYMNMAMAARGMDMGGLADMAQGGGGGAQVLRLTDEEMAAVNRLTEMGFDRTEAAQAYLACDKNEALAANLLMDGGFSGGADNVEFDEGGDDNDMYD